jgi:hypothetical protein
MIEGNTTLLITGGYLYHTPFPHTPFPTLFSLSASKASQFNLSVSLAQVYGPLGVHVATVVINGKVDEEGEGEMSAKTIAEQLWKQYEEGNERKKGEMSVVSWGTQARRGG